MLNGFLQTLRQRFIKAPKVPTLACYFCKREDAPLFRPIMEFYPNRNYYPHAKAISINMGRPTCAECREKIAWHNLADRHLCEQVSAASMKRYGSNALADFKATNLFWIAW